MNILRETNGESHLPEIRRARAAPAAPATGGEFVASNKGVFKPSFANTTSKPMTTKTFSRTRNFFYVGLCFILAALAVYAQEKSQPPPPSQTPLATPSPEPQDDEIVRISSELVQTDVTVVDKQGRFVDGLKPEQFELRIDGKPQEIAFFERVETGSARDTPQLAKSRQGAPVSPATIPAQTAASQRARTFIFFIDDLHLAADSAVRTRKTMERFIEQEMGANDQVAITTTSGQLGFLQQFSDDKEMLREAVSRLKYRANTARDSERPPMSEYIALAIVHGDRDILGFYVNKFLEDNPGLPPESVKSLVETRARTIAQQYNRSVVDLLSSLESLTRTSAQLPGRKLVFFLSDGFLLDNQSDDTQTRLRRVTDAAARSGVVVYALDARGLSPSPLFDASDTTFDLTGRLDRARMGEISASQDSLRTLAADTGGRALLNSNSLDAGITGALRETSSYYLLAWRPELEEQRTQKFRRIEVRVKDRPDLKVQVRRGYLEGLAKTGDTSKPAPSKTSATEKPADRELFSALGSFIPKKTLATSVSVGYMDMPEQGTLLTASMQVDTDPVAPAEARKAGVDIAGAVYDDKGKAISTFKKGYTLNPETVSATEPNRLVHAHQARLPPGLYQVRVAARDRINGQTGSAVQWVRIPDLAKGGLSLSSIFVGEPPAPGAETAGTPEGGGTPIEFSVDRRFQRARPLRFLTFIYNAARGTTPLDATIQLQVLRDNQPVITPPSRRIDTKGVPDPSRIPYAADITLATLTPGRYTLQVTATDNAAKKSSTQRVNFTVE